ncbi:9917_t:CDS:2, partial [Dentiscutata heterogama]
MLPGSSAMLFSQFLNNKATNIDSGDKSANESSINEFSNDSNDSKNDKNLNQLTVNEFPIASFFQTCNWKENRVNSNSHQHGGKRIKVQVALVARRKETANK